jgi:hypothetical protein
MKRLAYPYFTVIGQVDAFKQGDTRPTVTVKASCYISFHDDACRLLVRDAKYRLEQAGMPTERVDALYFDMASFDEYWAHDTKGVRRVFGEHCEAFVDSPALKKRDVLIRQRRLIPHDQRDMLEIYGPKAVAVASTLATDKAVAA